MPVASMVPLFLISAALLTRCSTFTPTAFASVPLPRALLTAVAVLAFRELDAVSGKAAADAGPDPQAKRIALGQAYIRYALDHRGRFDLMFRKALIDRDDPALKEAGERCFKGLVAISGGDPETDPQAEARAIACWALAHGLARLKIDGALLEDGDPEFVPMVLGTLAL